MRRAFDFLRGVDGLIWTILLSRAFGPGPLTGSLAILLTDTGTFGKIFSEALENVDERGSRASPRPGRGRHPPVPARPDCRSGTTPACARCWRIYVR